MDEETGENRQQTHTDFEEEQHANHSGVLRVYELCNGENQSAEEAGSEKTLDVNKDTSAHAKRKKRKIKPLARAQRLNHVKNDPDNRRKPKMIITVLENDINDKEEGSMNGQSSDKKGHDSDHDAWTDHNRWYCNLCKVRWSYNAEINCDIIVL